jgi:hypothetical protein
MDNFNFIEDGYISPINGEFNFNFGSFVSINSILKSLSSNIVAIWAESTAGLNNGKVYISTSDSFNIVSLETNSVVDYYTETHAGAAGETLQGNDTVDINIT